MLKLPKFTQKYSNDCGVASIYIILKYYDIKVGYKDLLESTKCKQTDGIEGLVVAKTLTQFGLDGKYIDFCSSDYLRKMYEKGVPVMVGWFSPRLTSPGNHWSVVQSASNKTVRLMDPALGRTRIFPLADFQSLWFTINSSASRRGILSNPLNHVGIREAVIPRPKAP